MRSVSTTRSTACTAASNYVCSAFHDDYGFQPIVVFDGEGRFVTALLRPGKRPGGYEIGAFLRRLVGAIRAFWPRVEILLRAASHYACPQVFDWCRENRVDWVLGLAPNAALRRHVEALEKTTAERFTAAPARGKVRRFAQFHDAAGSWSRVERIIARVEAGAAGIDTRFIVTNLEGGRAKLLYERLYCARSNRCLLEHANYLDPHRSATGDAIARDGNRDHVYRHWPGRCHDDRRPIGTSRTSGGDPYYGGTRGLRVHAGVGKKS